jgi:hypothetical protein
LPGTAQFPGPVLVGQVLSLAVQGGRAGGGGGHWALEPYPNWKLERPTSGGIGTGQALPRSFDHPKVH